ncbi:MAG: helix-turn-helix transcriptional regulator [Bacteroidales bacterium]|nr:helix-turn-helix transcriptional regulator [Bacteroidales bacterium]MBQ9312358.1 helix-turn-helix transcriptional regulator [Bacteroidales bacterium]
MIKKENKNAFIEICPVRNVIARFGNKWAILVLLVIYEEKNIRFSQLQEKIPDISKNILSSTLKTLYADDLISRKVYNEMPLKVEYSLTPRGLSLMPIIFQLNDWAMKNLPEIMEHRQNITSL